ncbi:hypothetical protein J8J27_31330, partial [Mycobacterium tuberculosis]|nr:hypothetical protein [Mycobacterium tuberculosis]
MARTFGLTNIALVPGFILRPLLITAGVGAAYAAGHIPDAVTAAAAASIATWVLVIGQTAVLYVRIRRLVPPGPLDLRPFGR